MRATKANSIEVTLAGRSFTLACAPDERADLEAAVAMVSERVDEAYAASSNATSERLLLLAALNMAHDLRRIKQTRGEVPSTKDAQTIAALQAKLDQALKS
jgi:cell division protein ZapA